MISEAEFATLAHRFDALREMSEAHQVALRDASHAARLKRGDVLFDSGEACENFLLLVEGSVRVAAEAEGTREILLYRVAPGELCVLTLSCLLGHVSYPARGVAEVDGHAVMLPAGRFDDLVIQSPPLRRMVFASLSRRVHDLMSLVEEVAFQRLDSRLAERLLRIPVEAGEQVLHCTHQELAAELGTAREIVSRLLSGLEDQGAVRLARRRIEVADPERLRRILDRG